MNLLSRMTGYYRLAVIRKTEQQFVGQSCSFRKSTRPQAMSLVLQQKVPLATVSLKVSRLEAHLQTKLFNRSTRALILTDAGRSYIAAAKQILADVAEAERDTARKRMSALGH